MKLSTLLIHEKASMKQAMVRMNDNCLDTIFVVDDFNTLKGVITDGDIRRNLLKGFKLDDCVIKIMNKNYTAASINDKRADVLALRKDGINVIPLVDEFKKVLGCIGQDVDDYIPIYDTSFNGKELEYITDCINKSWVSSTGQYVKRFE